uniref:Polymerase-associated protein P n=1 Tax=Bovine ephemeral fever virus TaxID=11303 RepID=A0A3G6XM65_BEFV|nr:polymerase-associated protein P [Bovine ephemeral fever virus]AZM32439.1 polymerase-associated protein P [Bovine ephemeral fever virus]AZM32451.1 polymerase-associated protein P [Bovine ephemeral fever virus]QBQ82418.1 polymerase-associated protein P [Bovine ephemeral fever virus]
MSHLKPKIMTGAYDAEKLRKNLQEQIALEEDELENQTDFENNKEESNISNNPLIIKQEPGIYPIEINLEDLEKANGIEEDWENSLLKIIESSDVTPKLSWDDEFENDTYKGCNVLTKDLCNDSGNQEKNNVQIKQSSLSDVAQVLSLFHIRSDVDYKIERDNKGLVRIIKLSKKDKSIESNKRDIIDQESDKHTECNSNFDAVMDQFQKGIRVKKRFGKGYVKINADNMPGTYHDLYNVISAVKGEKTVEEMIRYLFKKSKSFKSISKTLNIDEMILC